MGELYIGLMAGTSLDGIDAVIAEFGDDRSCAIRRAATTPFPSALRTRLATLIDTPSIELAQLGALDTALGEFFARCANVLVRAANMTHTDIVAIGHHGQTIFHQPVPPEPFTMQIGDPNVIAARTGITVVADLRRLDVALGGQGAPLMPFFHAWCFGADDATRAVVNIGGIANVSLLDPSRPLRGFDTGPGNTLLDGWISQSAGKPFDRSGAFAASGQVDEPLLANLLSDPFFDRRPPKSTGREYFNMPWLRRRLDRHSASNRDIQATLSELTAASIARELAAEAPAQVILCGGGAHNVDLVTRLKRRLPNIPISTSEALGIAPDWVEAAGCAWFARARLRGAAVSEPSVTGARQGAVLGSVYLAPSKTEAC